MKVFIDTNVLIDFLNNRKPFFDDAAKTIEICTSKQVEAVISALSVINAVYIMRKAYPKESLLNKVTWITEEFEISSIDITAIRRAIASESADFEDSVQYFSTLHARADIIITRNPKGFKDFTIPVMSPSEFIRHCEE